MMTAQARLMASFSQPSMPSIFSPGPVRAVYHCRDVSGRRGDLPTRWSRFADSQGKTIVSQPVQLLRDNITARDNAFASPSGLVCEIAQQHHIAPQQIKGPEPRFSTSEEQS
jgi:hypothetical protein